MGRNVPRTLPSSTALKSSAVDVPCRRLDRAGHAGDVDQNVDAAVEHLSRTGGHRLDLGLVGDIAADHFGAPIELAHIAGDGLERGDVAGGEQDIGAFKRQGQGDRGPHALGRARDDGGFAFKPH